MVANTENKENNQKALEIIKTAFNRSLFMDWQKEYEDIVLLGCCVNKIDNELVALYHNEAIHLIGKPYVTVMYTPKILFHFVSDDHLHIDDILMKNNDIGNGTIAMKALLKYSELNGVKKITGDLSSVDDDHKKRRDHFYKKFGFVVSDSKIVLNI